MYRGGCKLSDVVGLRLHWRLLWCAGTAGLLLPFILSACAFHYSNSKTGTEALLGVGGFRVQTNQVTKELQSVVAGSVIPGLCIGVGPDHFGISLGYLKREHLFIVNSTDPSGGARQSRFALPLGSQDPSGGLGLGFMSLRRPARDSHYECIIAARALAGVAFQAGAGTSATAGLQSQQTTVVRSEDLELTLGSTNSVWPYFDYFNHIAISPLDRTSVDQIKSNQGDN